MLEHFIKVCTVTPQLSVGDCAYNTQQIINCIDKINRSGTAVAVFPELSLTGYTCGDLFFQSSLLSAAEHSILKLLDYTKDMELLLIVGAPVAHEGRLFNTACILFKGKLLGIVPKSFLPNYNEFNEKRYFSGAHEILNPTITYAAQTTLISSHLLFKATNIPYFCLGIDICEDLWSPLSPSTVHTLYGATVIANLSASNETIGKNMHRKSLIAEHASKTMCAYLYTSSGIYESTSDMVFGGHQLIYEGPHLLAEPSLFPTQNLISYAWIDLEYLYKQRMRFNYGASPLSFLNIPYHNVSFHINLSTGPLQRVIKPYPFIPAKKEQQTTRWQHIFAIQSTGLARRMHHTKSDHLIVGVSGDLDSTLALLVSLKAIALLQKPRLTIIGVLMPGLDLSPAILENARHLIKYLGVGLKEISIVASTLQHFKDIEHDAALHDATYESAQSRERTQVLMDLATQYNGLVVGTNDLSELALGLTPYNGYHMCMYGINGSIPKTLIPLLIEYVAYYESEPLVQEILFSILETKNLAITEALIGPYDLYDFFIYYMLGVGYGPTKIYHLAQYAFKTKYTNTEIIKALKVFYTRFFASQFKRTTLPDCPKVGTISLSPRSDWQMPSDISRALWLKEIENLSE